MVQNTASARELRKAFFFFPKLPRMGNQAAAGTPRGVLYVQHLVIQNILHDKLRNAWSVHVTIQKDLTRAGIIATELPAPAPRAPADVRGVQRALKIFFIEPIE